MDTLETARLKLERWNVRRDAADLFAYAKNPNVGPNAGWAPHKTIRESRKRIRSIFIPNDTWKIVDKQTGRAIGSIGFSPDARRPRVRAAELGYSMSEEYWGLGLMKTGARGPLLFCRSLSLKPAAISSPISF